MIITTEKGGFVVFDYVILALAIVFNFLALEGTLYGKFHLVGYRRFLISLIASDIFICVIRLLLYMNQSLSEFNSLPSASTIHHCASSVLRSLLTLGLFTNLLNLCAMSVDHFIGIAYPMRYRYIMGKGIAKKSVIIVWIASFCFAFTDIFVLTGIYYGRSQPFNTNTNQQEMQTSFQWPPVQTNGQRHAFNCSSSSFLAPIINKPARLENEPLLKKLPNKSYPYKMNGNREMSEPILAHKKAAAPSLRKRKRLEGVSEPTFEKSTPRGLMIGVSSAPALDMVNRQFSTPLSNVKTDVRVDDYSLPELLALEEFISDRLNSELDRIEKVDLCREQMSENMSLLRELENPVMSPLISNRQQQFASGEVSGQNGGLCIFVNANKIWNEAILVVWALFSFIILSICYLKSYAQLRPRMIDSRARRNLRKLVGTTWLLLGVFALTWMPLMLYEMSMFTIALVVKRTVVSSGTYFFIHDVLNSLFICNPFLDIIIYVVRVTPVQKVLKKRYGRLSFCLPRRKEAPTIRILVHRTAIPFKRSLIRQYTSESHRASSFKDAAEYIKREARYYRNGGLPICSRSVDLALREEMKLLHHDMNSSCDLRDSVDKASLNNDDAITSSTHIGEDDPATIHRTHETATRVNTNNSIRKIKFQI